MARLSSQLSPELAELQREIEGYAREAGLDCFTTVFELVDYMTMCEVAAYGGFPVRYPHWRWGMEYDRLTKSYTYGLSKIYELVINTDPCYAYLLDGNAFVDQKLVMCHVYAHCDFFKNNRFFAHTDRRMIDGMANAALRIRRHMDRHGSSPVETFIDVCHSLDNLIDPWAVFRPGGPSAAHGPSAEQVHVAAEGGQPRRWSDRRDDDDNDEGAGREIDEDDEPGRLRGGADRSYLDAYLNPPEFIAQQRQKLVREAEQAKKIPPSPERDVLGFMLKHAPLERWEADVLGIVREEAYYFLPQMQTKILNEGWATYWHSKLMTTRALRSDEVIDYADVASGVTAMGPTQLNPYKIGVELFRDIEDRWNKGRFGKEWDECTDAKTREQWDRKLGLGREKIFEIRKLYNDVMFIDEFFTEDFCREQKFFTFAENRRNSQLEIESREFHKVKAQLLAALTNSGQPFIYVIDANYMNRGELLLAHKHSGQDLRLPYARDTLRNIERIWRRPVSVLTVIEDRPKRIRFDGTEISITDEVAANEFRMQ